jgi:hypothetical protein
MSSTVKFTFRVVVGNDPENPYIIQKKSRWFGYTTIAKARSAYSAEETVKKFAALEVMKPGTVVLSYTEQDYVVEKLKG